MRIPRVGLLLAALLGGCAAPSVVIVAPTDGATVCGDPLVVEVDVRGATLAEPTGDAGDGTTHVDVTLNGQDAAMFWTTRAEIANVGDGLYEVAAELSDGAHARLEPQTSDAIRVTVAADACGG